MSRFALLLISAALVAGPASAQKFLSATGEVSRQTIGAQLAEPEQEAAAAEDVAPEGAEAEVAAEDEPAPEEPGTEVAAQDGEAAAGQPGEEVAAEGETTPAAGEEAAEVAEVPAPIATPGAKRLTVGAQQPVPLIDDIAVEGELLEAALPEEEPLPEVDEAQFVDRSECYFPRVWDWEEELCVLQ
jgi:hypothetical protein